MSTERTSTWRERLTSPLTWHYAGFMVLLVIAIVLAVRLGLDWAVTNSRSVNALADKQTQLKALNLETAPLRGLDKRVDASRDKLKDFYKKRIPPTYSSISSRVDELAVSSGVRLTREAYTQGPSGTDLTEIDIDSGITGEYPQIMRFANSLERDPIFFVVRAMSLTGQQGGQVSLRLRLATWLRPADVPADLPPTLPSGQASPATPSTGSEGE